MITKQQYVEYLVSTPINYTCSNLAAHLDGVSHDAVTDYLQRERHTARHRWALARHLIDDSPDAFLIVDDTVQAKRYARKMDLVKRQYSGNEHACARARVVRFLRHLLRPIAGKLLVRWDGAPIQRRRVVKQFLADGAAARVWWEHLPSYVPERTPVDGRWRQLQRGQLRHVWCHTLAALRYE